MNNHEDKAMDSALTAAAEAAIAAIREHEIREHFGGPCVGNRLSAVAFLAHHLGLKRKAHLDTVGQLMDHYDANCPC